MYNIVRNKKQVTYFLNELREKFGAGWQPSYNSQGVRQYVYHIRKGPFKISHEITEQGGLMYVCDCEHWGVRAVASDPRSLLNTLKDRIKQTYLSKKKGLDSERERLSDLVEDFLE